MSSSSAKSRTLRPAQSTTCIARPVASSAAWIRRPKTIVRSFPYAGLCFSSPLCRTLL